MFKQGYEQCPFITAKLEKKIIKSWNIEQSVREGLDSDVGNKP